MIEPVETFTAQDHGNVAYGLRASGIEVRVVPGAGARIVSLRGGHRGEDWLWAPPLADPGPAGADSGAKPMSGIDECLPTIAACHFDGREYPHHGDVWSRPWTLDAAACTRGILTTQIEIPDLALVFIRAISIEGNAVRLRYWMENRSASPRPFLWALHPLLVWEEGDRLELSPQVRTVVVEGGIPAFAEQGRSCDWPSPRPGWRFDLARFGEGNEAGCAKLYAGPETGGSAALRRGRTGERLIVRWNPSDNPWLGVWINRGALGGHHHVAFEPTNCPHDSLHAAKRSGSVPVIAAGQSRSWEVEFIFDHASGSPGVESLG